MKMQQNKRQKMAIKTNMIHIIKSHEEELEE